MHMSELPPQLLALRDFYYQTALKLPAEASMAHAPGLITNPSFFTCGHLHRHINNPMLLPGWLSLYWQGKPVDCAPAVGRKRIQKGELAIFNKAILDEYLGRGAAVVLEGIEFLESDINAMCAAIDAPHEHVMSNAVVFFSQRGNEAYRGHFDTDDALIIHLAGRKKWRVYDRLAPRRVNQGDLTPEQMGRLQAEFVMNPGDALYVRNSTPHMVETASDYSLHMTFDICDHSVSPEAALDLLTGQFDRDATRSYSPTRAVVEKLVAHAQSPAFWKKIDELQAAQREGCMRSRSLIGNNRVQFFERIVAAEGKRSP